jgi:cytochrome P450
MPTATTPLEEDFHAYASLEPRALADRWSLFRRLRDEAPAFRYADSVIVTRHADVIALLLDKDRIHSNGPSHGVPSPVLDRLSPGERMLLEDIVGWEERWLTATNGERHAELRGLAQRVFAPRAIGEFRDRIVEVTEQMLGALAVDEPVEFIERFAYKLPLTIISEILDIPEDMREPMHETTNGMRPARTGFAWRMNLPRDLERAHFHFMEMKRQIKEVLERRRGRETTTIMGNVLRALDEGADEDDIVVLVQLLLTAGHRTTTDLLGTGLHTLLTHRDAWDRLREEPELWPQAIEEMLRYRSPSVDVERFATTDFELHGVEVRRGQHLAITVGAANHDERVFEDPGAFDIDREDVKAHVAFGRGPHFCLGNALTRLEASIAFPALARRFPDVELLDPEPHWTANTHLLGLDRLDLRMGPDRG